MRTQLGSGSSASRKYLFKDGQLDPSISLGSGLVITNNIIYTTKAGATNWTINYNVESEKFIFIKLVATNASGSAGNEAYAIINVNNRSGDVRFSGSNNIGNVEVFGFRVTGDATSFLLRLYTYANGIGLVEMWIE